MRKNLTSNHPSWSEISRSAIRFHAYHRLKEPMLIQKPPIGQLTVHFSPIFPPRCVSLRFLGEVWPPFLACKPRSTLDAQCQYLRKARSFLSHGTLYYHRNCLTPSFQGPIHVLFFVLDHPITASLVWFRIRIWFNPIYRYLTGVFICCQLRTYVHLVCTGFLWC